MTPDAELLERWRAGDREAGDKLVGRYFDPVCRFFRSKLGDDVEDLVQRTFLDLVEGRDTIERPTVRSFVFAVARNRLFDHLRRRFRQPVDNLGSRSVADLAGRASGMIAASETRAMVLEAMRTLPLDFQITLELAYWEGLSGAEIASVLSVSPHTVRSRAARARQMLREALAKRATSEDLLAQSLREVDRVVARDDL